MEIRLPEAPITSAEQKVLQEVLKAVRRVQHGYVQLVVQDARVVQIETTEKKRIDPS